MLHIIVFLPLLEWLDLVAFGCLEAVRTFPLLFISASSWQVRLDSNPIFYAAAASSPLGLLELVLGEVALPDGRNSVSHCKLVKAFAARPVSQIGQVTIEAVTLAGGLSLMPSCSAFFAARSPA